jgi:subtilisin family serine protease
VGAVPYYDPDHIEVFSSRGNSTIYFDPAGNRLTTAEVRLKPDLVAPDQVNTTSFGTDIAVDADLYPNFAGTSAAAPHVAGVAALLLGANPHLTRSELYTVLTSTAVDLGEPGRDSVYGFGRVDAAAALNAALAVPDVTSPTARLSSPIDLHSWNADQLVLALSEPLDATRAAIADNYQLTSAGPDGQFNTADDIPYTVSANYDSAGPSITLTVTSPATLLPDGLYRLTLDATGGLQDESGNPLNGGLDQTFDLTIAAKSEIVETKTNGEFGDPRVGQPLAGGRQPATLQGK